MSRYRVTEVAPFDRTALAAFAVCDEDDVLEIFEAVTRHDIQATYLCAVSAAKQRAWLDATEAHALHGGSLRTVRGFKPFSAP